jgi:hypothetical protein
LQKLIDLTDEEYESVIASSTCYFILDQKLWRCNSQGKHQLVVPASIMGDLYTADARNFASYSNHSFVMAHKLNWENALQDANKVTLIYHSLVILSLSLIVT